VCAGERNGYENRERGEGRRTFQAVVLGLSVEIVSLLWFHPFSFVVLAFVATASHWSGNSVFLTSLVLLPELHKDDDSTR